MGTATSASHLSFTRSLQHVSTLYPLEIRVSLSQRTSKTHDIGIGSARLTAGLSDLKGLF